MKEQQGTLKIRTRENDKWYDIGTPLTIEEKGKSYSTCRSPSQSKLLILNVFIEENNE